MRFNPCPLCAHANPATARACLACGVGMVATCAQCGAVNDVLAVQCVRCSTLLPAGEHDSELLADAAPAARTSEPALRLRFNRDASLDVQWRDGDGRVLSRTIRAPQPTPADVEPAWVTLDAAGADPVPRAVATQQHAAPLATITAQPPTTLPAALPAPPAMARGGTRRRAAVLFGLACAALGAGIFASSGLSGGTAPAKLARPAVVTAPPPAATSVDAAQDRSQPSPPAEVPKVGSAPEAEAVPAPPSTLASATATTPPAATQAAVAAPAVPAASAAVRRAAVTAARQEASGNAPAGPAPGPAASAPEPWPALDPTEENPPSAGPRRTGKPPRNVVLRAAAGGGGAVHAPPAPPHVSATSMAAVLGTAAPEKPPLPAAPARRPACSDSVTALGLCNAGPTP